MNNVAFARAADIATAVREAGGRALIVGGWVRDRLMGRESNSKDIDLEVYGLTTDRVRSLLESLGHTVEEAGPSSLDDGALLRIAPQKSGSHDAAAPIWFEAS